MTASPPDSAGLLLADAARPDADLARRAAMLDAMIAVTGRFIGHDDGQSGMEELLRHLGTAMGVVRASLHQVHALETGGFAQVCLHEWTACGVPRLTDDPARRIAMLGSAADRTLAGWACELLRGRPVHAAAADLGEPFRSLLEAHGVRSTLIVPVMIDGRWWGHIAFDDAIPARAWSALEIEVLESAAATLAGTIQRTRTDAELHRSEARRRAIVESALDCILTIDASGLLVEFNPAAERTFGYTRADALGRRMEDLVIPPAGRDAHRRGFARYLAGEGGGMVGRRVEVTAMRADGGEFPAELSVTPSRVCDELFFTAYLRDITDRKVAEAALIDAKAKAEAAAQAKTTFLATMSHELRTPLNAIIGFSELIMGEALGPLGDAKYQEFAADIFEGANHLLAIINDVLDMSRIEAGEHSLSCETIDLGAVVRSCLTMMRDRAVKAGVTLVDDTGILPIGLWADRRAVMKILLNLLSNAVKFTPPGGSARVSAAAEPDGTVVIAVGDTGVGMAADALAAVFEPFRQGDGSLKRRHEGAGLGLTVTRALVELHGGTIVLSSSPGQGTTATLRFPSAT
ncbi:MAG TPA: PAS domain S-box protein [Azospirillum sp.]|nr:PAS domain S-box protein [Azospirillum sp.]